MALTSSEDVVGNGERIVPFMAIVLFRGKICEESDERLKGTLIHASIEFSVLFLLEFFFFKLEISYETLVSYIIILIISIVFLKFLVFIYLFIFFSIALPFLMNIFL